MIGYHTISFGLATCSLATKLLAYHIITEFSIQAQDSVHHYLVIRDSETADIRVIYVKHFQAIGP